ncbi:MAG: penicillin-binding transpeptidase domain-containing protein [Bacteroidota bacterium]
MNGHPDHPTREQLRTAAAREVSTRMLTVKIALLVFFLAVTARLVQIQVIDAAKYQEIARRQHTQVVTLPALRGEILDRQVRVLVSNSSLVSYAADPKIVADSIRDVAVRFAEVFGRPASTYLEKLRRDDTRFVWLERRVPPEYRRRIPSGRFGGVVTLNEPRRLYHYAHTAGQLIGLTDIDNHGLSGLELELDSLLRGRSGSVVMQRDALNRQRPSVDYPRVEPVNGNSVVLTIDIEYQGIVEQELRKGVEANHAESGLAVMLDPSSGEVLAMATCVPGGQTDTPSVPLQASRNRVISDMVEPGSVFKIVTAGAALERNLVTPEQKFDAEEGTYKVYLPNGRYRNTITDTHKNGIITFQEAMEVSSNIVMAKVSDLIGSEALYTTARNFGFGTETGIGLPGEVRGELKMPTQWSGTTLNSMSYGYEVASTPLQIAAAYAAVANGGVLMKPFVVKSVLDPDGRIIDETRPERVRRVISKETADVLSRMLHGVVERGTGKLAGLRAVAVAGKTGTARKYENGRYVPGSYIASFVGFFPTENPSVVCLVMLDLPGTPTYTGGLVSAPIFRAIAQKIHATSTRFAPRGPGEGSSALRRAVPDVTTMKVVAATATLAARGFETDIRGDGGQVARQSPEPGTMATQGTDVVLMTVNPGHEGRKGFSVVPDLRGFSIRRAVNRLAMEHLDVAVTGSGVVQSQSPKAGEQVKAGTRVAIRCGGRTN